MRTNREFDTQKEALEFIRQRFQDFADGQAYTGKLIVKKMFHAIDERGFSVDRFSSRGYLLFLVSGYKYQVIDAAPCEAWS